MWITATLIVLIIILLQVVWVMLESWYGVEAITQEQLNGYVDDARDIYNIYTESRH